MLPLQDDIKQAARQLQACTEKWQENELLKIANDTAVLIEKIQLSLGLVSALPL